MLGVRLDAETEQRLERLAKLTGRSKSHYAKLAIQQFLDEREDYLLAIARLEDQQDEVIDLADMRRRLGLDA
jgi:RHH-type rel operon transcriptional repressor/antitoxin RelB